MKKLCTALLALPLLACMATGPEKALNTLANALETKDSALFLAQMDGRQYAATEIRTKTAQSRGLSALDSVGRQLGLGGVEDVLGSIVDMEADVRRTFTRGVDTGELEAQCRVRTTADCPWVAASLRAASITEINATAAVARVTTPAGITSWLALNKRGEQWLITGKAPSEALARAAATRQPEAPASKPAASGSSATL